MKRTKEQRAITLIALAITIIVILILTGVTITTLTGNNGLITQANKAKEQTEKSKSSEASDLANLESLINEYQDNIIIPQVTDKNPGQLEQENDNTFVINSIEDLVFFSYDVTNGNKYENQTVKLGENLDFNSAKSYANPDRTDFEEYGYSESLKELLISGVGFIPIGSQDGTNSFYGIFDGNNKVIRSLYINIKSEEILKAGLFANSNGVIQNLGLIDVNIVAEGKKAVAVGGIIGKGNNSDVYNSYVTGNINVIGNYWTQVGGICGNMEQLAEEGNIENCYNLTNINVINNQKESGTADIGCGGILGQGKANINKCYNKGNIICDGKNNTVVVGGICGTLDAGLIKNCYNTGKVQGKNDNEQISIYVGGISGALNSNLSYCYNIGEVIGNSKSLRIGGITANQFTNTTVENVFNLGVLTIQASSLFAGGITGMTDGKSNININYAYNIGLIKVDDINAKSIGSITSSKAQITFDNCYYLTGTYDVGVGKSETTQGVTELKSIDEFPSVLDVVNKEGAFKEDTNSVNNGYPIMVWQ